MKYRSVLVAGVFVLVTGIVAATVGAIALVLNKSAQQQVVEELARSRQIFEDLQSYRRSLFRSQTQVVADEPRLKAVAGTMDISAETVLGVAQDLRKVLSSDLLLITDAGSELRADASDPAASGQSLAGEPLLARAMTEGQAAGIWIHRRRVYQVQAQRLSFGPRVVGALVIGFEVDNRVAETVYRQTGSTVLLQLDGRIVAGPALAHVTGAGGDQSASMLSAVRTGDRDPVEVNVAGTRYLAIGAPVPGYSGTASLRYVVLRSLDEALAPGKKLLRVILTIAVVSLLLAVLLTIAFARRLSRPIDDLVAHTRLVAAGDLTTQARVAGPLELQALGTAMNRMVGELRALHEGLERRVAERTRELTRRGRDMRLVLNNVAQGFLTIDARGYLAEERSAAVDRWFGGYSGEITFADFAASIDPGFGQLFALGYDALKEGILPADLCLGQLPRQLRSGGREFRAEYTVIEDDAGADAGGGLLIVISDVTDQLANAQKEAEQREAMALFQGLMNDRSGHLTFFEEAAVMMERMNARDVDLPAVKLLLHTMKGNAGVANLHVLAGLCDRAEDEINEAGAIVRDGSMAVLRRHWAALDQTMKTLLGQRESNLLELDGGELEGLCKELEAGASAQVALERLRFIRLEPAERPFWRLAKHAVELGKRLGKVDVAVRVDTRGIRTDPRRWAPLWSDLVHLVRNAVDHGLETPDERRRSGKPARPHVWFEASIAAGRFVVTLGDDGRGIDWIEVRRLARLRGLPAESEHDLTYALFSPGLTTRRVVTAISGRGIGLTAVRERVEQLGGTISVESQIGRGSSWSLSFPLSPGGAETVMAPARRARATGAASSVLPG